MQVKSISLATRAAASGKAKGSWLWHSSARPAPATAAARRKSRHAFPRWARFLTTAFVQQFLPGIRSTSSLASSGLLQYDGS